jgi:hypothetical protein
MEIPIILSLLRPLVLEIRSKSEKKKKKKPSLFQSINDTQAIDFYF